jgi:hypothetical protein
MARPKIPIDEGQVENLAAVGCSVEEIASLITPPGSKRAVDHRTIERRFAPALKKGRHRLAGKLRSELVKRAMNGDTTALIFACKTILKMQEPLREQISVNVAATANAAARTPFVMTDAAKKKIFEATQMIRREALRDLAEGDRLYSGDRQAGANSALEP